MAVHDWMAACGLALADTALSRKRQDNRFYAAIGRCDGNRIASAGMRFKSHSRNEEPSFTMVDERLFEFQARATRRLLNLS
jgi:hypothetical protein